MFRRKRKSRNRRSAAEAATTAASRGIVTVSICAGAGMWGYAIINLAT